MKSEGQTIDTAELELNDSNELELFCEYGGGSKKYHLYARDKETGALVYIGSIKNTSNIIKDMHDRHKKAAEHILKENATRLIGIESLEKYVLRPFSWAGTETGLITK